MKLFTKTNYRIRGKPYELKKLDEILLRVLRHREIYGLEIIENVKQASGGEYIIKVGSLYPKLRVLERRGLIRGRAEPSSSKTGGGQRRYYMLTEAGEDLLQQCFALERNLDRRSEKDNHTTREAIPERNFCP